MSELVSGRHAVTHVLKSARRKALSLHLLKGKEQEEAELVALARKRSVSIRFESPTFFASKLPPGTSHQGVVLDAGPYPYVAFEDLFPETFLLILDEIQDPQNLGALCRSAYLFGVGGIVIPETRAAPIGPGACQASVGAVEYLKIARASSIAKVLENLKKEGFWIYGADHRSEKNVHEENYPEKVALVIGNEERGLRKLVRETCDLLIRIPTVGREVDSLNASVAGGVILYEISRQRSKKTLRT